MERMPKRRREFHIAPDLEAERRRLMARNTEIGRAQNPERDKGLDGLRTTIAVQVGTLPPPVSISEAMDRLTSVLDTEPQRDQDGNIRYLLTSGLAVELTTGFERDHHDVDFVIMDPSHVNYWEIWGTDNVTPGQYWAHMKLDPDFLSMFSSLIEFRYRGRVYQVETVDPAIILIQKLSNTWGRNPRQKDLADARALVSYWAEKENRDEQWTKVQEEALDALPSVELRQTLERLREMYQSILGPRTQ